MRSNQPHVPTNDSAKYEAALSPGFPCAPESQQQTHVVRSTKSVDLAALPLPATRPALLTKLQLARELQCSERHVERLQRERKIPVIRLSSRCVRYSRERVLSALARGCEQEAVTHN